MVAWNIFFDEQSVKLRKLRRGEYENGDRSGIVRSEGTYVIGQSHSAFGIRWSWGSLYRCKQTYDLDHISEHDREIDLGHIPDHYNVNNSITFHKENNLNINIAEQLPWYKRKNGFKKFTYFLSKSSFKKKKH